MSLNVSPLSPQDYDTRLKAFIKSVEGEETLVYVDFTGKDKQGNLLRANPTIGWGFALNDDFSSKNPTARNPGALNYFLNRVLGVNPDPNRNYLSATAKIREQYWENELKRILNSYWVSDDTLKHTGPSSFLLRDQLNDVLERRAADIATNNYNANDRLLIGQVKIIFKYDNSAQMAATFDAFKQDKEDVLNRIFGANLPQNCNERVALYSMAYQGTLFGEKKKALIAALNLPNGKDARAEAWYAIRYLRDSEAWRGYMESAVFGLYDDNSNVQLDDAQSVFRMFTNHRKSIFDYDTKNQAELASANARIQQAGIGGIYGVPTILQALDLAKTPLLADLRTRYSTNAELLARLTEQNIVSTNIYLNPHKSTDAVKWSVLDSLDYQTGAYINGANDLMIGMDQSGLAQFDLMHGRKGDDILIGEGGNDGLYGDEGNDILHGGAGNDWLFGGMDNDTLIGGAGEDTYTFKFWDGNDTIIDSNGTIPGEKSNIIYEDALGNRHDLGTLVDSGCGDYFTTDGLIRYSNGVFTLPGGGTITLQIEGGAGGGTNPLTMSQNALGISALTESSSDPLLDAFGINLIDLPADIPALPDLEISNTIVGDLAPVDFDPVEEGIQMQYDQWGNVIVDPEQPEPGRSDMLYDTTSSDKIEGGAGSDTIIVSRGSGSEDRDWVLGGDGNDSIQIGANGNILVEGESGDDNIETTAENVNARIYGGAGDDVIDTDSNGDGWLYGGEGWDIIDGNRFDNCIIEGGAGSDIIWGAYGETDVNRLFADSYGEMEDFIAAGEIAASTNQRGEIIGGAAKGGNYIYGSDGYDILVSGGGKDLIVGGGSDDLIMSDFGGTFETYRGDNYTWAYTIEVSGDTYTPVVTGVTTYSREEIEGDDDVVYAGTGSDFVQAGGGDDEIYGSAGNDTIFGEAGHDFIEGGEGDDILVGDNGVYLPLELNGNDYIDGGAGNDLVQGDGGDDELYGGADNDTLAGGEGDDYLNGEAGLNTLYGGAGNDFMEGGDDTDLIIGEAGADAIYGGGGNDSLHGDASDTPLGDQGDDYIDGGAGDDSIWGYSGNNTLYGGDGNDSISGDDGDDYIDAGDGANVIVAGGGNNEIYAGTGDDQITGGSSSDTIDAGDGNNIAQGQDGDDVIYTGVGSDQIWGGAGADEVYGGAGNDQIYTDDGNEFDGADFVDGEAGDDNIIGAGGDDTLYGGDGNDTIQGDVYALTGNDYLDGGAGADTLLGQAGDDILYGGTENDYLQGDSGSDTYIFGRGDGADNINNGADDYATAIDTIQVGAGINDVTIVIESPYLDLRISINGTDDSLLIWNWGSDPSYQVDQIIFSDGTVLTPAQVEEKIANTIYGTSGNNTLTGGTGIDAIYGYAGNDSLSGGGGNDVLTGGVGNDALAGGAGNDAYVFNIGDGVDTIEDVSTVTEGNTIYFGEGITPGDISVVKNGTALTINVGSGGDAINLLNFDENEIAGSLVASTLQFTDGTALAPTDFMNLRAPVVLDPIADQTAAEEAPFSFTVPEYTFGDQDINDTLTYSATKADGSALPSWLSFDSGTMTLSGTPGDAGILSVKVTATDAVGHSVSDDFDITVTNEVNDAPFVAHPIADQIGKEDTPFNFTVPGNTFSDVDPGDTLTYSATKADGSALPSWLSFDPGTMTFSGTPASGDLEGLSLRVTATDAAGASVSDDFNVGEDNPPVVANPIDDQNATEDAVFNFTVPGNTFSDVDLGDTLTYSATKSDGSALPSWLAFDPGTRTLSGTPTNDNVGILPLKVTATDTFGLSVSDEFNVTVINTNDAPVVLTPIDDQTTMEDAVFSFTVPGNTFSDVDLGDTLAYSATLADGSALPSWLAFDPETKTFTGTAVGIGTNSIKVTAMDNGGLSVSTSFNLEVQASVITGTENDDNLMGTPRNNIIYGLGGNDTIYGLAGDDTLSGGTGADTMIGGTGHDTYVVDNTGDVVTENASEGTDTVQSSVTYTLGNNVENLTLMGTSAINGTGNTLDNYLTGNSAVNTLIGGEGDDTISGGTGADSMIGGIGHDTYIVDTGDVITENANEGTDTVESSIAYSLNAVGNENVENLTLTGTSAINGFGNALDNYIIGNSAANTLYGQAGNDTLSGGDGNDSIRGYDGNDQIDGGVGNDTLVGDDVYTGTGNDLLSGGSGDDRIYSGAGNDTLSGGAGNDYLQGTYGDDTYLFGRGDGVDEIDEFDYSYAVDTVVFGEGITFADLDLTIINQDWLKIDIKGTTDTLIVYSHFDSNGQHNINQFRFVDGTVMTAAQIEANGFTVYGTSGNDSTLRGASGPDRIFGYDGNDTLSGYGGNDTLDGGAGNDQIGGGDGDDTYLFGRGSGADTIYNYDVLGANDAVQFGEGITAADLDVSSGGNTDLVINIHGTTDSLTIASYFYSTSYRIPWYKFADSTMIDAIQLEANRNFTISGTDSNNNIQGTYGNDTIYGLGGNDSLSGGYGGNDAIYGGAGNDTLQASGFGNTILDGGTENDSLAGGDGNDTYVFGRGYGQDTVGYEDFLDATSDVDTIFLDSSIQPTDVAVAGDVGYSGLILSITGSTDTLTVPSWFSNDNSIQSIEFFDGTTWDYGAVNQMLSDPPSEGDDVLYGSNNDDTLQGLGGIDFLLGFRGDDLMDGGSGDDDLDGGPGNDTYIFGLGSGQDFIFDYDTTPGNIDTVMLGSGITPDDVNLSQVDGIDLVLSITGSSDTITLINWLDSDVFRIERIVFDNGTVWDVQTMQQMFLTGTENADIIYGFETSDTIDGRGGDDELYGAYGNDTIYGGAGNDTLYGGYGDDDPYDGDDYLDGGAGADRMYGGPGDDTYVRDNTGDIVTENANEGTDTVQSSVTYTLGNNVENLTLTGTSAINGTGNTLDNVITGNSANNTLSGGTGADTMIGGLGNDTYVVENTGDVVTENANEGTDTIQSSFTYTLADNVENLTLTGSTAVDGTGNTLDNSLTGNTGANTLTGGDGNDTLSGGTGVDTMIGGLGNDTYVVDNTGDVVTENASEGADTIQSSVTYTLADNMENLTLTGSTAINGTGNTLDNSLTGNTAANSLTGGVGNDTLSGGTGADTMVGGLGNDTYVRDNTGDVVTENASEGTDTVQSSVTYTLGNNVENLTLTGTSAINGTGNTLDNYLTGNTAANSLTGGAGNDTLNGGTGADIMTGGTGDDTYVRDNTGDSVTESASQGTDTVQSSVTYTLGSNVENLTLTGTSAINGTGNTLSNVITGNSANNTLSGGTGADTMIGGLGNDTYVRDNTGDVVTENANEGTDTIQSSLTYTLADNVENLTLTGSTAINGTGNTLDNSLTGNTGANTLTGGAGNDTLSGGTGADSMLGGLGDDTYVRDNTGDVVTENASEGTDTVQSSVTYTLGNNVENLTLTGSTAINGTGNTLDNSLTGNTGANTLTGGAGNDTLSGGTGADSMLGGLGNDTYVRDNTGDVVTENASEGTDTVQSSVTYTLGNNVENLTLTGTSAINGTGNTLDNYLTGNSAANTLTSGGGNDTLGGGAGNDSLIGGIGNDIYAFMRGDGQDKINDYDTTTGNSDKAKFGSGLNPIDLILVNNGNNLDVQVYNSSDLLTVQDQNNGTANQVEVFEAGDGSQLLSSQVGLLIQAMADLSTQNSGMSWTELIQNRPADVQQVLAQYWQPPQ